MIRVIAESGEDYLYSDKSFVAIKLPQHAEDASMDLWKTLDIKYSFTMNSEDYKSEIRSSIIRQLLEKARKGNYFKYLNSITLERIRFFQGAKVNFDFPITALIGPNGGGKSTILGAAALAYSSSKPENFFVKSRIGDNSISRSKF